MISIKIELKYPFQYKGKRGSIRAEKNLWISGENQVLRGRNNLSFNKMLRGVQLDTTADVKPLTVVVSTDTPFNLMQLWISITIRYLTQHINLTRNKWLLFSHIFFNTSSKNPPKSSYHPEIVKKMLLLSPHSYLAQPQSTFFVAWHLVVKFKRSILFYSSYCLDTRRLFVSSPILVP